LLNKDSGVISSLCELWTTVTVCRKTLKNGALQTASERQDAAETAPVGARDRSANYRRLPTASAMGLMEASPQVSQVSDTELIGSPNSSDNQTYEIPTLLVVELIYTKLFYLFTSVEAPVYPRETSPQSRLGSVSSHREVGEEERGPRLTCWSTILQEGVLGGVAGLCELGGGEGPTFLAPNFATGRNRRGLAVILSWEGKRGVGLTSLVPNFTIGRTRRFWQSL
jgi:hypothetical protein